MSITYYTIIIIIITSNLPFAQVIAIHPPLYTPLLTPSTLHNKHPN